MSINQGSGVILVTCQLLNGGQGDSYLDRTGAEGVPERVLDHTGKPGLFHGGNKRLFVEGVPIPRFRMIDRRREHPGREDHLPALQFFQDGMGLLVQRHMPGLSGLGQRDCENP